MNAKKSYTLSPESVDFLEAPRKKRRARSISFVLEEILQAARREAELAKINQSVTDYYASLSDEEAEELSEWGKFGLRQLLKGGCLSAISPKASAPRPDLVCSLAHRPGHKRKTPGCDRFARHTEPPRTGRHGADRSLNDAKFPTMIFCPLVTRTSSRTRRRARKKSLW